MKRILLDCDGPLSDLRRHIVEVLCIDVDYNMPGQPREIEDWIPQYAEQARAILREPEFWLTLPVTAGAQEGVERLRSRNADITILTKPYKGCPFWYDARVEWLCKNFGFEQDRVLVGKRKNWVAADRFIDDQIENIQEWERENINGRAYLFSTAENVMVPRLHRIDWSSIDLIF